MRSWPGEAVSAIHVFEARGAQGLTRPTRLRPRLTPHKPAFPDQNFCVKSPRSLPNQQPHRRGIVRVARIIQLRTI
jgi:hypothetical protein